jgi:hypothetical protein
MRSRHDGSGCSIDRANIQMQLACPTCNICVLVQVPRGQLAGKPNDDLAPGTLNSILKQAGLSRN